MSAPVFFEGVVDGEREVWNMPRGSTVNVQTDGDLTIAYWNDAAGDFGSAEDMAVPGGPSYCPHYRTKLSGNANVSISLNANP